MEGKLTEYKAIPMPSSFQWENLRSEFLISVVCLTAMNARKRSHKKKDVDLPYQALTDVDPLTTRGS